MFLGSITSCHLDQEAGIDGQLAVYFLLSLAVQSYSCSDRFNKSDENLYPEPAGN